MRRERVDNGLHKSISEPDWAVHGFRNWPHCTDVWQTSHKGWRKQNRWWLVFFSSSTVIKFACFQNTTIAALQLLAFLKVKRIQRQLGLNLKDSCNDTNLKMPWIFINFTLNNLHSDSVYEDYENILRITPSDSIKLLRSMLSHVKQRGEHIWKTFETKIFCCKN